MRREGWGQQGWGSGGESLSRAEHWLGFRVIDPPAEGTRANLEHDLRVGLVRNKGPLGLYL